MTCEIKPLFILLVLIFSVFVLVPGYPQQLSSQDLVLRLQILKSLLVQQSQELELVKNQYGEQGELLTSLELNLNQSEERLKEVKNELKSLKLSYESKVRLVQSLNQEIQKLEQELELVKSSIEEASSTSTTLSRNLWLSRAGSFLLGVLTGAFVVALSF